MVVVLACLLLVTWGCHSEEPAETKLAKFHGKTVPQWRREARESVAATQEAVRRLREIYQQEKSSDRFQAAQLLLAIDPREGKNLLPFCVAQIESPPTCIGPHPLGSAFRLLVRHHPETVPALLEAMKKPDLRGKVIYFLGEIGPRAHQAVPVLRTALRDPDPCIRVCAAWALPLIDPRHVKEAVVVLLGVLQEQHQIGPRTPLEDDRAEDLQRKALEVLAELGPAAQDALPLLLKEMQEKKTAALEYRLLDNLARAVVEIGPESTEVQNTFLEMALSSDIGLQRLALDVVAKLDSDSPIPQAIRFTVKRDTAVYSLFISLWGRMAPVQSPAAIPFLAWTATTTQELHDIVANGKAYVLGQAESSGVMSLPPKLIHSLRQVDLQNSNLSGWTRLRKPEWCHPVAEDYSLDSLRASGEMVPAAKEAVPKLLALYRSKDKEDIVKRQYALRALVAVAPAEAQKLVPEVCAQLRSEKKEDRRFAAKALVELGPICQGAMPALVEALENPELHLAAVQALGKLGPAANHVRPALLAALRKEMALLRLPSGPPRPASDLLLLTLEESEFADWYRAGQFFHANNATLWMEALQEILNEERETHLSFLEEGARTLGRLGLATPETVVLLETLQQHPEPMVRWAALLAQAKADSVCRHAMLPVLRQALQGPEWTTRLGALYALVEMDAVAEAMSEVQKLRQDTVEYVRKEARLALARLQPSRR
jgi:HEAT repeat protein